MPPALLSLVLAAADFSFLGLPTPIMSLICVIGALVGLSVLLKVAGEIVNIWDKIRAKPASHEVYATKKELHDALTSFQRDLDHRLEFIGSEVKGVSAKQEAFQQTMQELTGEVNRALGRLEGAAT